MEIADIFVLNKADREGADRLEQQLHAMLSLVMPQDGWHPPVVRTVASENRGVDALAATIGKFREHFESQRRAAEKTRRALEEASRGVTGVAPCSSARWAVGRASAAGSNWHRLWRSDAKIRFTAVN